MKNVISKINDALYLAGCYIGCVGVYYYDRPKRFLPTVDKRYKFFKRADNVFYTVQLNLENDFQYVIQETLEKDVYNMNTSL